MKRYTEYKDSGVPWIGEIPKDWEIIKIKYLATEPNSTFIDGDWIESNVIEDDGIRYFTTGNIGNGQFKEQGAGYISEETFKKLNCLAVYGGDLIISRLNRPIGRACIIPEQYELCVIAVDNVVLRPNCKYNIKFLMYCMNVTQYNEFAELVAKGATMQRISRTNLGLLPLPIPSSQTQKSIADYLDQKTADIDSLIEDKQKMIDLLKEKRQAIISEAVTKGLDKNVQMKDSGIEWIGEIPEHWEVKKLSYIAKTISGGTPSRDKIEYWKNGTIPWMSSGEINNEFISNTKEFITALGMQNSNAKILPKHTVMMALNGQGKTKGMTAILEIETTCNQSLVGFVCDDREVEYKFLFYVFKTIYKYIRSLVGDESREGLSVSFLRQQRIAVPSISEQQKIIQYLDSITYNIEDIIRDVDLQIKKLKEYRQAIISEAVTGKVAI